MLKTNQAKLKKKLFFIGLALFFCLTTGFSWPGGSSRNNWWRWWDRHRWVRHKNHPPQVGSISPSSGYSLPDRTVYFTTTYFDADGYHNLADCRLLINTSTNIKNSFCARYDQNTNKLYLINDNGSGWQGGFPPGSKHTIQNSFSRLDCSKTTVKPFSTGLVIKWSISFKPRFSGRKNTYLYAKDDRAAVRNWTRRGTWTIRPPSDTIPPTGSIRINNGDTYTNSASVTLSLTAKDNYKGSGLSRMQFSNDGRDWSTPERYAATKSWTLTSGSGTKRVYARFQDRAGNWSSAFSDTIILNTTVTTNISYSYDDLNRLQNIKIDGMSTTYTYDEVGNIRDEITQSNAR